MVASLAEGWIEIGWLHRQVRRRESLPSRKRGLKLNVGYSPADVIAVASLAEAWIEIGTEYGPVWKASVASLAEAWIEIGGGF